MFFSKKTREQASLFWILGKNPKSSISLLGPYYSSSAVLLFSLWNDTKFCPPMPDRIFFLEICQILVPVKIWDYSSCSSFYWSFRGPRLFCNLSAPTPATKVLFREQKQEQCHLQNLLHMDLVATVATVVAVVTMVGGTIIIPVSDLPLLQYFCT